MQLLQPDRNLVSFFLQLLSLGVKQYELDEVLESLGTSWASALRDISSLQTCELYSANKISADKISIDADLSDHKYCTLCKFKLCYFILRRCLLLIKGIPIAKVLGYQKFCGRKFLVNKHVLIPRDETELLVDVACRYISNHDIKYLAELGVGSGCILFSIMNRIPDLLSIGIDISQKAINVAKFNRNNNTILLRHSWNKVHSLNCEMIISNPPYVAHGDQIDESVRNYDPQQALFGGKDGLNCFRRISKISFPKAKYILLEIGFGQFAQVYHIFSSTGLWKLCESVHDGKCERVLIFERMS